MQPNAQPMPKAMPLKPLSIEEFMQATLRLSDVMHEESQMLSEHRIKDLAGLHEEKLKLTQLLELYQLHLTKNPEFLQTVDAKQREELVLLADDLAYNVEENFRKVSAARAVNSRVMQAIMDVVTEHQRPGTYGRDGAASHEGMSLSVNLDQKA